MEGNSDDTLLGGFGEMFNTLAGDRFGNSESINGFQDYSDDEDLSDAQIRELQLAGSKTKKGAAGGFFDAMSEQGEPAEEPEDKTEPEVKEEPAEEPEPEEDLEDEIDEDASKEGTAVKAFFNVMAEELGLEVEDKEAPQTVEDLANYFRDVIEENSVPTYASDEVRALDEFVRNGGNIRDYFSVATDIDFENFDIDSESNQELIVKEFLMEKGFSNAQIQKKIMKYKDADLLADEAEDALEFMKDIKADKQKQLLEDQKNQHEAEVAKQQAFFNDVIASVKTLDNVRGVKVPEKDREMLAKYIFKKDANGLSQYQKDYAKDSVKNLLESAYFTMKGDTLIQAAEKDGKSAAMKALKQSLNSTSTAKGTKRIKTHTNSTTFSRAVQQLFSTN